MKKKNGFTVAELLTTIIIIAIVVVILGGVFATVGNKNSTVVIPPSVSEKNISIEEQGIFDVTYGKYSYVVFVDKTTGQRIFWSDRGAITILRDKPE